jgi:uncharacterized radical SAM protein YgiQ
MNAFLPTSREEMNALGWDQADIVFVSGDAYVDHPSFAAAILGRVLEAAGYRCVILAQPDWRSADAWRELGRPRLFYAVSAGNMDSMINHYTANRKRRNADAYSPGGRIGLRPDRPTAVYAQRCREAHKGVPVIIGGVEASLRRIAHFDYWSDKVLPSILLPSKADLLVFGMGEGPILEIARKLADGASIEALRSIRSVAYLLGKNETLPDHRWDDLPDGVAPITDTLELPELTEICESKHSFARMTRRFHYETNPLNGRRLTQRHGDRLLVINPASLPFSTAELDRFHELPYTRLPHPRYEKEGAIPAWQTIKESVQIMRGCFGGCTFCSITMHQGKTIQSRSERSVLAELKELAELPHFKGHVSDLGGPTANMYRMECKDPKVEAICRRPSCLHPKVCKLLGTDHKPLLKLMRDSRRVPGVKRVNVASGIRMDLAAADPVYLDELAQHHVGGLLKIAPEHVSDRVLNCMKKPGRDSFDRFSEAFNAASKRAGKKQYIVPYFICGHPGSEVEDMIELALYLKENNLKPLKVQDFIPAPMDVATCMFHTGLDPTTMQPVFVARTPSQREEQRALLQYFLPNNYKLVSKALLSAGREDLIGSGTECLIPARPPRFTKQLPHPQRESDPSSAGYRHAARRGARRTRK